MFATQKKSGSRSKVGELFVPLPQQTSALPTGLVETEFIGKQMCMCMRVCVCVCGKLILEFCNRERGQSEENHMHCSCCIRPPTGNPGPLGQSPLMVSAFREHWSSQLSCAGTQGNGLFANSGIRAVGFISVQQLYVAAEWDGNAHTNNVGLV